MRVGAFADFCMGSHAVLVTGGAQNIGARIASILAGAGAQVMFADLIAEEAAETAADARGMGCDVTDKT